jgi:HSP20 family molecular chaperone IbpA
MAEETIKFPGKAEEKENSRPAEWRPLESLRRVKGEKKDEREEKQKDYHLSERRYGSFQRSFGVPDGVDADKIEAHFKNGVLTVTLPKRPEAQKIEKKIAIKTA